MSLDADVVRDRLAAVRRDPRRRRLAVVGAVLLVAPLLLPRFQVFVLTEVLILALFATGFNLLYGYTGLLSFGHAMFYATGGYTLALTLGELAPAIGLAEAAGGLAPLVGFLLGVVLGVAAATLLAVPVGYLSVRLEEIYFAMITLSFSMALYTLALQDVGGLTNGSDGLQVILGTAAAFGGELALADNTVYYYVVLAAVVPAMYALWRIVRSPFGEVCRAIRENPERAAAVGIDVRRHRLVAFVLSAAFTGLAGVLIVPLRFAIVPAAAHWTTSAEPVIIVVLGGPYHFAGPALGAVTFRYLRWIVTQYPALEAHWQLVFGILLLVVLLFFKGGVAAGVEALRDRLSEEES